MTRQDLLCLSRCNFLMSSPLNLPVQGINVRHKSAAIRALLQSPRLLRAEREAAQKKRREYKGFSRDDLASGGQASADGVSIASCCQILPLALCAYLVSQPSCNPFSTGRISSSS